MKINVEFDLTPDEFRRSLGLPDVEAFQQDLLQRIQQQVESGVEGYDPMTLMQPFLQQSGMGQGLSKGFSQGLANFGTYQQMMLDMLNSAASSARSEPAESTDDKQADTEGKADTGSKNAGQSTRSTRASSTSARSRNTARKKTGDDSKS